MLVGSAVLGRMSPAGETIDELQTGSPKLITARAVELCSRFGHYLLSFPIRWPLFKTTRSWEVGLRGLFGLLVAVLTIIAMPRTASAWAWNLTCPLPLACRWDNAVAGPFKIATVNFPNGSADWWELINAVNQHDGYPGTNLTVTYANDASLQIGDFISLTDNQSHVIYSDIDSVGGTHCEYDGNLLITACDIMFDPYVVTWGVTAPTANVLYDGAAFDSFVNPYYKSLMSAMAHELGHAMGLGHPLFSALDQSYSLSTMAKADRWPYPDLYPVVPLRPDDGAGLRFFYPGSGEPIYVSIAHYYPDYASDPTEWGYYIASTYDDLHPSSSAPYAEFSNPQTGGAPACSGDSLSVTKTLLNAGTQTADRVGMGYYLSLDPNIDPASDILIENNEFTLGAEDWMRNTVSLTLPYAAAGTYYVGGVIDPDALYETSNRTDNTLIFGTVEMQGTGFGQPCGPSITGRILNIGSPLVNMVVLSFENTLRASSGVYEVTITSTSVVQAQDAPAPQERMPYTVYGATVNATLFGPVKATLRIRQPGGAVKKGGIVEWGVLSSEAKLLEVGKKYIVFRGKNDNNAFATGGGEAVLKVKTVGSTTQVMTFDELPLVGFTAATNTFAVRPDYFSFLRTRPADEARATGQSASAPVDLSALDATPMTLAQFKAALAEVRSEGDFTPVTFRPKAMSSYARVGARAETR